MKQTTIESELISLIRLLPPYETKTVKDFLEFLISKSKMETSSFDKQTTKVDPSKWKKFNLKGVPRDCKFDREFLYSDSDRGA